MDPVWLLIALLLGLGAQQRGLPALVGFLAAGFVLQYAIGANATFSVSAVFTAMIGTHFLIGIGEALITFFAVGAVLASRSDLVYGYKNETSKLEIRANK